MSTFHTAGTAGHTMTDRLDRLMQQMRPTEQPDARAGELVSDVLRGIDAAQRRRLQRRREWLLHAAALLLALGAGLMRGESGARSILAMNSSAPTDLTEPHR
ncbi:MAG: hypothetical protein QM718_12440 [Steroidobacteraceae bacterium]